MNDVSMIYQGMCAVQTPHPRHWALAREVAINEQIERYNSNS